VLLASAQFSGESASGWQQVNFSTPVLISSGTTLPSHRTLRRRGTTIRCDFFATSGVGQSSAACLASGVDGANRCLQLWGHQQFSKFQLRGHELLGGMLSTFPGIDYVADRDRDCSPERYQ